MTQSRLPAESADAVAGRESAPSMSVIVPSVGRPQFLARCIADLLDQDFDDPFEIIVVHRPNDAATWKLVEDVAADKPNVRSAAVQKPGIVHALRVGVENVRGGLVAFCDDDARYPADWLRRLHAHFADE